MTKFKNLSKNTSKNFKNQVWTWPRTWPGMATNVAGTWPRTWPEHDRESELPGHVVMWPECSAMLWAMFWPRWTWPKRGQKVTALRRTWPETWPATWPRGRQRTWPFDDEPDPNMARVDGHVAGHVHYYFHFFRFFSFFLRLNTDTSRKRLSHKYVFLKWTILPQKRFFYKTFQNANWRNRDMKFLLSTQTG